MLKKSDIRVRVDRGSVNAEDYYAKAEVAVRGYAVLPTTQAAADAATRELLKAIYGGILLELRAIEEEAIRFCPRAFGVKELRDKLEDLLC